MAPTAPMFALNQNSFSTRAMTRLRSAGSSARTMGKDEVAVWSFGSKALFKKIKGAKLNEEEQSYRKRFQKRVFCIGMIILAICLIRRRPGPGGPGGSLAAPVHVVGGVDLGEVQRNLLDPAASAPARGGSARRASDASDGESSDDSAGDLGYSSNAEEAPGGSDDPSAGGARVVERPRRDIPAPITASVFGDAPELRDSMLNNDLPPADGRGGAREVSGGACLPATGQANPLHDDVAAVVAAHFRRFACLDQSELSASDMEAEAAATVAAAERDRAREQEAARRAARSVATVGTVAHALLNAQMPGQQ